MSKKMKNVTPEPAQEEEKRQPVSIVLIGNAQGSSTAILDGMIVRNLESVDVAIGTQGTKVTLVIVPEVFQSDMLTDELLRERTAAFEAQQEETVN